MDFEKAFDSISFSFMKKCLKFFNFSDNLIKWVNLLLLDFKASINHCGNISKRFDIGRGCRQGDPIAPYLFIISVELLAHKLRNDPSVQGFSFGNITNVLDLYADDMTIYLSPSEQNLKNVLKIIKNFFHLSCLKINVSKTKAVWFGASADSDLVLCPEEKLIWTNKFELLGLSFDNRVEKMSDNYKDKLKDIEKLLQGWLYRHLSPFGKITIIKSLALSKLSHIALVVPTLPKKEMSKLEQTLFSFLWSNKNAKVSKQDAFKPLHSGGLAMVDITSFWKSLKCSWLRRLLKTDAFWPKILQTELGSLDHSLLPSLFYGPSELLEISKKIKNKFWKDVYLCLASLQSEVAYASPENFYLFSIFRNPLFKHGNRALVWNNFGNPGHSIRQVGDLYKSDGVLLSLQDLNQKYGTLMSQPQLTRLQTAINNGIQSLNLNLGRCTWQAEPKQSIMIHIASLNKKGCQSFYRIFRSQPNQKSNTSKIEAKWHATLGSTFSVNFWNNSWKLQASIRNNNFAKWLQCQTLRGSLYTNNRVSKFKPNVSDQCDFCAQHVENPYTLFYQCPHTQAFWSEVKNFLSNFQIELPVSRLQILFGIHDQPYDSVENSVILLGKRFIWASKHKKQLPNFSYFKKSLKDYLYVLGVCHTLEHTRAIFDDQWGRILDNLAGQDATLLPHQDDEGHG